MGEITQPRIRLVCTNNSLYQRYYLFQISGTAAKLGQPNAYHHCTLLVNSSKANLGESLAKDQVLTQAIPYIVAIRASSSGTYDRVQWYSICLASIVMIYVIQRLPVFSI